MTFSSCSIDGPHYIITAYNLTTMTASNVCLRKGLVTSFINVSRTLPELLPRNNTTTVHIMYTQINVCTINERYTENNLNNIYCDDFVFSAYNM